MRLVILWVALFGMLAASEDTEFNEPSLCLQETNPFSYSHCIRKRDTECQNGGFCGTCNSNSCQTCNGSSCKTTCNGNGCNECPSGNCCNSQNCNVCSGMNCCNSNNCNSCTNSCNNGCSTFACRSACLQTCQTLTVQCNCNWGINNCFGSCRNQCFGDHCYESCFKNCNCNSSCPGNTTIVSPTDVVTQEIIRIENNPNNSNPVNISTTINLKNIIINQNTINNPINITNVQHTDIKAKNTSTEEIIKPPRCCYVIHPVHCFDIEEHPYKRCIQKRHWECSDICISVVVHLVHLQGPTQVVYQDRIVNIPHFVERIKYIPNPNPSGVIILRQPTPLPQPQPRCNFMNQYPWVHCSHYQPQGCGSCYVCGNQQYNPTVCSTQPSCAGLCRGGIVYDTSIASQILKYAPIYASAPPSQIGVPLQIKSQRNSQG